MAFPPPPPPPSPLPLSYSSPTWRIESALWVQFDKFHWGLWKAAGCRWWHPAMDICPVIPTLASAPGWMDARMDRRMDGWEAELWYPALNRGKLENMEVREGQWRLLRSFQDWRRSTEGDSTLRPGLIRWKRPENMNQPSVWSGAPFWMDNRRAIGAIQRRPPSTSTHSGQGRKVVVGGGVRWEGGGLEMRPIDKI